MDSARDDFETLDEPVLDEEAAAATADAGLDPTRVTYQVLRRDPEIVTLIRMADKYLETIGYTDHGLGHISRVSTRAYRLLAQLGMPRREAELAAVAGLLHDIGNMVHRESHPQTAAVMAFGLLRERRMPLEEVAVVLGAIGNHDEENGDPVSNPGAALIIADKSDVLRSRVRNPKMINFDIHDRVNYAAKQSALSVDPGRHLITLTLEIDTRISQVMEYFEIFLSRMRISRRAANFLNCDFELIINKTQVL
ncbi:MAG: HD domain-containing protein [bacterium]|nr:HD domain-containing protein [bacterium]